MLKLDSAYKAVEKLSKLLQIEMKWDASESYELYAKSAEDTEVPYNQSQKSKRQATNTHYNTGFLQ